LVKPRILTKSLTLGGIHRKNKHKANLFIQLMPKEVYKYIFIMIGEGKVFLIFSCGTFKGPIKFVVQQLTKNP